jgi:tetratricopeptide (TPR) repeat protein
MNAGKYHEACGIYKKGLSIEQSNVKFQFEVYRRLGEAKFKLGQFREACNLYTQALQINDQDATCLFERAQAHFKLKEFIDCIIDCEESLNITPDKEVTALIKNSEGCIKSMNPKLPHETLKISVHATKQKAKNASHKLSGPLYLAKNNPKATTVDKLKLGRKLREINAAYNTFTKQ